MELIQPFSYIFASQVIPDDLSELHSNTNFANGRAQTGPEVDNTDKFRILESYQDSKRIITNYFNNFVNEVFEYRVDFEITTSWMTKLGKGERVHYHNHVNSMWSGVFYFDEYTDDDCALQFTNPIRDTIPVSVKSHKNNVFTNDCAITPEHNLLIFFPSLLYHHSQPNMTDERKSLAFNFMPNDLYGDGDSSYTPKWFQR